MTVVPLFKVRMVPDIAKQLEPVLLSGYIGQGEQVERFERRLQEYTGHDHILSVNSATSGLTLAMRLVCGVESEPGEVLAPPLTCTATNWPVLALGQKLRWVDTNPADGNMSIEDLQRKLSPRTRAILVVHWGGYPNDMDGISRVQDECEANYGFRPQVIEDAAHAFGARYRGRMIGTSGNYCVFSFQAIKHLTCGDGGALLCPDGASDERGRLLRWFGIDRTKTESFRCEQDIPEWGYKFHMNDISATIGLANFSLVEDTLKRHKENAAYYRQALGDVPGVRLLEAAPERESSSWLFTIRADRRDDLKRKLVERGIESGMVHKRNDQYTCVRQFLDEELPGTSLMDKEMLCIPVGWWVSMEDRERIASTIREGW